MIDLYFLIPSVNAQIFNPTAELIIPTKTPTNDPNAEIETQPLIVEMKIRKCFRSLNHYVLFLLKNNFLYHLFF